MENIEAYKALAQRIHTAQTREELEKRSNQCSRHYNAGTITPAQFKRLEDALLTKVGKL